MVYPSRFVRSLRHFLSTAYEEEQSILSAVSLNPHFCHGQELPWRDLKAIDFPWRARSDAFPKEQAYSCMEPGVVLPSRPASMASLFKQWQSHPDSTAVLSREMQQLDPDLAREYAALGEDLVLADVMQQISLMNPDASTKAEKDSGPWPAVSAKPSLQALNVDSGIALDEHLDPPEQASKTEIFVRKAEIPRFYYPYGKGAPASSDWEVRASFSSGYKLTME